MKNIRNLTALMSGIVLAMTVISLPAGAGITFFNTDGNRIDVSEILIEKPETNHKYEMDIYTAQQIEKDIMENPCTVSPLEPIDNYTSLSSFDVPWNW